MKLWNKEVKVKIEVCQPAENVGKRFSMKFFYGERFQAVDGEKDQKDIKR